MASQHHGAVTLVWGDGEHRFRLDLAGIEEIEAKCECSLFDIARRSSAHARDIKVRELREVLRCGLIGGGLDPAKAFVLVRRYLDERPLDESRDAAYAVILAGLARVEGDKIMEAAEGEPGEPKGPSESTSPASAPQPLSSASTGPS